MANVNFLIVSSGSELLFFKSSVAFPAIFLILSSLSSLTFVSLIQRQNKALVVMVNCLDNDNNNNNNNNNNSNKNNNNNNNSNKNNNNNNNKTMIIY